MIKQNKSKTNQFPKSRSKLEANFRESVGWGKSNSSSRPYLKGYFPYKIYQDDFVVPSFSEKLRECGKDRG
jgi:hypothetical protein